MGRIQWITVCVYIAYRDTNQEEEKEVKISIRKWALCSRPHHYPSMPSQPRPPHLYHLQFTVAHQNPPKNVEMYVFMFKCMFVAKTKILSAPKANRTQFIQATP